MANINVNFAIPGLPNPHDYFSSEVLDNLNWVAGKVFRAAIIIQQRRGFLGARPINGENPNNEFRKTIRENQLRGRRTAKAPTIFRHNDKIRIIDLDYKGGQNRFYDYVELPFVPGELSFSMDSKFMAIGTIGRNNPFYQYTGSEDELEFTIDWYSDTYHVEDVIFNCRWLEALTKTDGYSNTHRVKLMWGKDDRLFRDDIWKMVAAPYKLSEFNRGYKSPETGQFVSTSLLPRQALQTVKLKRVSKNNMLYSDIMGSVMGGYTSSGVYPTELNIGNFS